MTHVEDPALEVFLQAVLGRKAENVVALDVRDLTSIADVFIVCSGRSNRQVSAIADHIERELRKQPEPSAASACAASLRSPSALPGSPSGGRPSG